MATATAPVQSHAATAGASRHTHAPPHPPNPPQPSSSPSIYAAEVEPDEAWVRLLQDEQRERFSQQAALMHREYLLEVDREGPFAPPEMRTALLKRYEERLERLRVMQMEELDSHIEMERQERLWSLGLEDHNWEGWHGILQEQIAIFANIKRTAAVEADASIQERIRENARETEDNGRRSEEWQRTEPQRMADRARWAERTRLTNAHVGERRQRDLAEAENQAAQIRAREEHLRETLAAQAESLPSSRLENLFSASNDSTDTAPSSAFNERLRASPAVSIPLGTSEARLSSGNDRASPADDVRRTSPVRMPPQSGTPMTSQTMTYAKGEESAHPTVWIPPEGAREPSRKSSGAFDNRESARKSSGVFDGREPTRKPSGLFDVPELPRRPSTTFGTPEESTRKSFQTSPSPQHQSQPQSQPQPPNAPSMRSTPLPTPQSPYAPTSQVPQPQQHQPRPTTQQRPATTSAFPQFRGPEASTVPPLSGTTAAARPTPSPTSAHPTQASRSTLIPPSKRPAHAQSQSTGTQDPAEERRRQLREQYTREEPQRIEEERRRREEQENERRAQEARRRGAEKRRAEEEARDAERREAERKETERRARAGLPKMPVKAVGKAEVWDTYEKQWAAMASATQLRFRSIPWPVFTQVLDPAGLIPIHIATFILSPAHSQGKTRKDRLKEALLRWHPDRFEAKWLHKVIEEEREDVKEGVGLVVRALNELLSADGTFAA